MNLEDLAKKIIGLGAPVLGTALGGPLGGAAAAILAEAIGASSDKPDAIAKQVESLPPSELTARLNAAQDAWAEAIKAQAEMTTAQTREIGKTMRAEIAAGVSWYHWRHLLGYVVGGWVAGVASAFVKHMWLADGQAISNLAILLNSGFAYFGAACGLLGYVAMDTTRRTTSAAAGEASPTILGSIIKSVSKGK